MITVGRSPNLLATQPHRWSALAVLLTGAFMALLDTTIVNVALPSIRTSLAASNATLSWIVSGYALAFGLALIPAGRLGGGIFFTPITALIQLMFTERERGRAFAILGATIGVSTALGPLVGGLILEVFGAEDGWRLVFGVNIPIGLIAMIAAVRLLPARTLQSDTSTDWPGVALLSTALVAILFPVIEGQQAGWPWWTYMSLTAGLLLLVLFAGWELHVENNGGHPLVPPRLFAHPAFTGGVLLALVYFAAFTSIFFTIALLWQVGLGHSPLQSGLVAMPFAVGSIIGAAQSDTMAARFGRVVCNAGLGLVAVGITALCLVLWVVSPASYTGWLLCVPLLIAGVGSGLFIAPNTDFIVATVRPDEAGAASGVIGTTQRVGSATGIAVIGTVLFSTLHVAHVPGGLARAFGHSAALATTVSAGLSIAAFALGFLLPHRVSFPGSPTR